MQKNRILKILFLFLLSIIEPSLIIAQTSAEEINTLDGFDTLEVIVGELNPDLERIGLTKAQIQTDVEIKLRRAGFKVKGEKELFTPYILLVIRVGSNKNRNGIFALDIRTSLFQKVFLERKKSISVLSTTWEVENIGTVGEENVKDVRNLISDQVDKFINDWLKANSSTQNQSLKQQPTYIPPPPATSKEDDSPFTATYVGGNSPPTVEVFNDSNRTMYFDFGQGK